MLVHVFADGAANLGFCVTLPGMSSKRLIPTVVATSLLLATGLLADGVSNAEEAILIPGAMPFKQINPIYPIVAKTYPDIGKFFHADGSGQLIEYSQNPLAANRSLRDGVDQTVDAIEQADGPVVVIGESMGAMVAWRVAEELAKSDPAMRRTSASFSSPRPT